MSFGGALVPYLLGNPTITSTNVVNPTGAIIMWPTSTPPNGYLNCDGSAISRTTYASLFNLIGTTYGVGNGATQNAYSWSIVSNLLTIVFINPNNNIYIATGNSFTFNTGTSIYSGLIATNASSVIIQASLTAANTSGLGGTVQLTTPTTFNLPNAVGVTIRGSGTSWTIGSTGGSDTTVLAVANIPPHEHKTQMPGSVGVSSGGNGALGNQFNAGYYPTTADIYDNTGTLVTAAANPATSFSTRNAYLVLNYCIKY